MISKDSYLKQQPNPNRLVVIATYNERENISALLGSILNLSLSFHVLVVDNNSPDGTGREVSRWADKEARVRLLSRPVREGYGPAALAGILEVVYRPWLLLGKNLF